MTAAAIIGWCLAAWIAVPFVVLAIELLAALLPARRPTVAESRPRVAVLVPAHNEAEGIAATLAAIRPQLNTSDRLLVVADNCDDGTAAAALAAGADVTERHDAQRRGKGFALDHGLKQLAADPPDVVIVVDADTDVAPDAIDALARAAAVQPVQGVNLLYAPPDAGPGLRISAFAFLLKNLVRPRGVDRMGLPCLLYGTGMGLPWPVVAKVDLAHGDITEDIRLGVELAMSGCPARFCAEAAVRGRFPADATAAAGQRKRWEHGHLRTLTQRVPRLLLAAFCGRPRLLALALHLGVPPLAFLFLAGGAGLATLALLRQWPALAALAAVIGLATAAILLAWARFGRDCLPARDLLLLPLYVLRKIPLYLTFMFRPQREWVRTKRDEL